MKIIFGILVVLFNTIFVLAQASSSAVEIVTVYSQNEKFYLKSTPFDDDFPTLRGKTSVYEKGKSTPLYEFERGFDSVDNDSNNLMVSNNGEVIFFLIPWGTDEKKDGLKSLTIYKNGKIFKSFTEAEITGCDYTKERCDLLYSNYEAVVDKTKSKWGTRYYKKVFKDGIDEKEKFLSDFPIFCFDDTVYLTDSKKKTHIFDLKEGNYVRTESFENIFEQIKANGRLNKVELQRFESAIFLDYPNLKNGKTTIQSLADFIGMKPVDYSDEKDKQFRWYSFEISSSILQNGSIEIEETDIGNDLPKEKIIEFFKNTRFDSSSIPKLVEKWYIGEKIFFLRKADDNLARKEKQEQLKQQREEFEKRMTAEKINDVYIPKDLGECFTELDRLLKEVDRKEMQSLPKREDMIKYHLGLGMWLRNNWGLWGGSRLQKYFTEKGINHPDEMSGIILEFYHDWLNGKKETWKDWKKNPKQ